jgi:hypothetical protein
LENKRTKLSKIDGKNEQKSLEINC